MVTTSFWYVSVAPAARVETARPMLERYLSTLTDDPEVREALTPWEELPGSIHGPDGHGDVSPLARRFLAVFRRAEMGEEDLLAHSVAETEELTWDLEVDERPHPCEGFFAAVKGIPVASLLHLALGPQRIAWLPGAFGVFAVTADSIAEAADGVRRAHALSPADRVAAIERMHSWLGVGEDPGYPVHHLLEALPEVFGTAGSRQMGVIGVVAASTS